MLYHVPSGSKSSGWGLATGWLFWNVDRLATVVVLPSAFTRSTPLRVLASPWEQPAPAKSAYSVLPMNATSATPLTRLPWFAGVWSEGRLSATVVTVLSGAIFEIRAVNPPV